MQIDCQFEWKRFGRRNPARCTDAARAFQDDFQMKAAVQQYLTAEDGRLAECICLVWNFFSIRAAQTLLRLFKTGCIESEQPS